MKIATKYILSEYLPTFFICFIFFFMMYIINHILVIIKPLIEKNIPFDLVWMMIVTILPTYTMFSFPFSILLATLMTIGRFSGDNEIVAFKSVGISLTTVFKPVFITGIIVMLVAFGINDRLKPLGMKKQFETRNKIATIKPTLYFKSKTVKKYGSKVLFTDTVKDTSINGIIIIDRDNDNQKRIISAKKALFQTPEEMKEAVEIQMEDAMVQFQQKDRPQEFHYGFAEKIKYYIKFMDFDDSNSFRSSADVKNTLELLKDVKTQYTNLNNEINNKEGEYIRNQELFRETAYSTYYQNNRSSNSNRNNLRGLDNYLNSMNTLKSDKPNTYSLNRRKIDFYDKFSLPLACIIFVIFGAPIGIYSRRAGYAFGFIVGLMLCGVYWFFYYGMIVMGKKMVLPPFISVFLPNLVFFVIGIIILIKRLLE
ncbi:MAG: LptF/LptG family permease [Spirochaetales bacterium]|nr:LptF/LptG family permease [Spirochaetales bacterium]